QRTVSLVAQLLRITARIISIAAIVVFSVLTAAWLWVVWLLFLGRLHLYDQLKPLNGWHEWLTITALYLLLAIPVLLIARLSYRIATDRKQSRISTVSESSLAVLWGLAVITLVAFGTVYAHNFRDYINGHNGKIKVGSS